VGGKKLKLGKVDENIEFPHLVNERKWKRNWEVSKVWVFFTRTHQKLGEKMMEENGLISKIICLPILHTVL
jgi:hypothetical protein